MKKYLPFIFVFLFFITPSSLYAQTITVDPVNSGLPNAATKIEVNSERIQNQQEIVEQNKEAMREQFEEKKTALVEGQQSKLQLRFERVIGRFNAASERITNIIARIRTRMEKMKTNGLNVAPAEAQLVIAEENMESAQVLMNQAQTEFNAVAASSTPLEDFQVVKSTLLSAKQQLIAARTAITEAVTYLLGLDNTIKFDEIKPIISTVPVTTVVPVNE